jgi:hypothetical protein
MFENYKKIKNKQNTRNQKAMTVSINLRQKSKQEDKRDKQLNYKGSFKFDTEKNESENELLDVVVPVVLHSR